MNFYDQCAPHFAVEHLQCIRDDRVLFDDVNFSLSAGQLLQIEGANGSGKTSLLRILCGLSLPSIGTVYWKNKDIQEIASEYQGILTYIGHIPGIKADLTPLENLTIAHALALCPTTTNLTEALQQMGLAGYEDVPTRTLSAGQQRRVALARLLVNTTPLWILDEPFTALDKMAVHQIEDLLNNQAKQGGIVIFTSHHVVNCATTQILHLSE